MVTRFGTLTDADRARQAESFVAWFDRSGQTDWREAFARWAGPDGKDFQPLDAWAIASRVERTMAVPVDALTDPYDFLRFAEPAA